MRRRSFAGHERASQSLRAPRQRPITRDGEYELFRMALDAPQPPPNADASWPPRRQYLAVRRAIEDEWERCEPSLAGSGLRFVLASEWSEAASKYPDGSVVRAWIRDAGGLRLITVREFERVQPESNEPGGNLGYVSLTFHVCADGRHVVYGATAGGRSYFGGGRCWIDPTDPRLHPTDGWL